MLDLRHSGHCLSLAFWLILPVPLGVAQATNTSMESSWPGAELFNTATVCSIRIDIRPSDLEKLRLNAREFVPATVIEKGTTYADVGVHLKGSVGSFRPVDDKPALTLDFARFHPTQRFHGLRRIHLNNSVEDPTYSSEFLGSELFRRAGIPAPRVSRAVLTLNQHRLGLYVLKEGFTEDFISCYFQPVGSNLFEPDEGHDVNQHLKRASLLGVRQSRATLKELAKAALDDDLPRRWQGMEVTLDLDRFIDFMVLEVILCHRDGYCLARNNFRIYQDVQTGKLVFLPHGMDQLFGIPEMPWRPQMAGLVARSLLETPEGKVRFAARFATILGTLFKPLDLTNEVERLTEPLRGSSSPAEFETIRTEAAALEQRIVKRFQFLQEALKQPEPRFQVFQNHVAKLTGWSASDPPASGEMDIGPDPDRLICLHIRTRSESFPSWRVKVRLNPGQYKFEARVRVRGVEPLPFGAHQGAAIRVAGQSGQASGLVGTRSWQSQSVAFQVDKIQEIELICELRAKFGEAWFDCDSLQLIESN